jgi:hypothetical protein
MGRKRINDKESKIGWFVPLGLLIVIFIITISSVHSQSKDIKFDDVLDKDKVLLVDVIKIDNRSYNPICERINFNLSRCDMVMEINPKINLKIEDEFFNASFEYVNGFYSVKEWGYDFIKSGKWVSQKKEVIDIKKNEKTYINLWAIIEGEEFKIDAIPILFNDDSKLTKFALWESQTSGTIDGSLPLNHVAYGFMIGFTFTATSNHVFGTLGWLLHNSANATKNTYFNVSLYSTSGSPALPTTFIRRIGTRDYSYEELNTYPSINNVSDYFNITDNTFNVTNTTIYAVLFSGVVPMGGDCGDCDITDMGLPSDYGGGTNAVYSQGNSSTTWASMLNYNSFYVIYDDEGVVYEVENTAPIFNPITNFSLARGYEVNYTLNLWDYISDNGNNDSLTYDWTVNNSNVVDLYIENSTGNAIFTLKNGMFGSIDVYINVSDSGYLSDSTDFTLTVENTPNPVFNQITNISSNEDFGSVNYNLSSYITDYVGSNSLLTYNWTISNTIVTISIDNVTGDMNVSSIANLSGSTDILITTIDQNGLNTPMLFNVLMTSIDDIPWMDLISNNTITLLKNTNGEIISNLSLYFRDVEDDNSPYNQLVVTNESRVNCSISINELNCSANNNFLGNFIITYYAEDNNSGGYALQDFEINIIRNGTIEIYEDLHNSQTDGNSATTWISNTGTDNRCNNTRDTQPFVANGTFNLGNTSFLLSKLGETDNGNITMNIFNGNNINGTPVDFIASLGLFPVSDLTVDPTNILATFYNVSMGTIQLVDKGNYTFVANCEGCDNTTAIAWRGRLSAGGTMNLFFDENDAYNYWNGVDNHDNTYYAYSMGISSDYEPNIEPIDNFNLDKNFGNHLVYIDDNISDLEENNSNLTINLYMNDSSIFNLSINGTELNFSSMLDMYGSVEVVIEVIDISYSNSSTMFIVTVDKYKGLFCNYEENPVLRSFINVICRQVDGDIDIKNYIIKVKSNNTILGIYPDNVKVKEFGYINYFTSKNGIVNGYYAKGKLYPSNIFTVEVMSNDLLYYSSFEINPKYRSMDSIDERAIWMGLNANYLAILFISIIIMMVLLIIIYMVWRMIR